MMKIKSSQEKTTQGKPLAGPNVVTPQGIQKKGISWLTHKISLLT
jgi:hypothetical protein